MHGEYLTFQRAHTLKELENKTAKTIQKDEAVIFGLRQEYIYGVCIYTYLHGIVLFKKHFSIKYILPAKGRCFLRHKIGKV